MDIIKGCLKTFKHHYQEYAAPEHVCCTHGSHWRKMISVAVYIYLIFSQSSSWQSLPSWIAVIDLRNDGNGEDCDWTSFSHDFFNSSLTCLRNLNWLASAFRSLMLTEWKLKSYGWKMIQFQAAGNGQPLDNLILSVSSFLLLLLVWGTVQWSEWFWLVIRQ
jgi:hypothetical protein